MIYCHQLNTQKCRLASQMLLASLTQTPMISFITEPYTVANKVVFRPSGYQTIPEATCSSVPRAALFIPRQIDAVALGHLNTPDCATAVLKWENEKVLIASIYLDGNDALPPEWMVKILEYAEEKELKVLLAIDTNAHSPLYSEAETDVRGARLEEFIFTYGLTVENQGLLPTFQTSRANSIIDVTLTRDLVIQNWHVSEEYNASDHNSIFFQVNFDCIPPKVVRPWKKADWRKFTDTLHKKYQMPERMTIKKVDHEVYKLYKDIEVALDAACPTYLSTSTSQKSEWFTDQLRSLQIKVKKQYRKAQSNDTLEEHEKFKNVRNKFRRRCRRAKNRSWRKFVSETTSEHKMAELSKIALHKDRQSLNIVYNEDMTPTDPGFSTITRLVNIHFPEAKEHTQFEAYNAKNAELSDVIQQKYDYITPSLVEAALGKFKPNKAPGPDGLKPILFKYFPTVIHERLSFLYKCCLHFHYTPRAWQRAKVIFLAKPGKKDYRFGKSYRPIVLSNFLLKAMERLITWQVDKSLIDFPVHPAQHGFQKGKGTEGALSSTCNEIEKFVMSRQYCLGVFLDISSAYDSISISHIRESLYKHGADTDLVEWYFHYLSHRVLSITLHGDTATYNCAQGFPQGGVASAKFWIIAFDPAVHIINQSGICGNGYADDLSMILGGDDSEELIPIVQKVIDELVSWGQTCNFNFNPEKTVTVGFTRARKKSFDTPIQINGQALTYVDSVKYLGLTLDKRLTWRQHLLDKLAAGKRYLLKMSNIARTLWGPKPHLMRWTYTCMVRPMILYGSLIWCHKAQSPGWRIRLRHLNRLAMNTYTRVHRSTPTRALEIISDTIPLHLYIKKEAACAYARLRNTLRLDWSGRNRQNTQFSHLNSLKFLIKEVGIDQLIDKQDECYSINSGLRIQVHHETFQDKEAYRPYLDEKAWPIQVFTDGSKHANKVGAAFCILREGQVVTTKKYRLPDRSSVFQAELIAIQKAAVFLRHMNDIPSPVFFVDSQAAMLALKTKFITSQVVLKTIDELNRLRLTIHFVWVKSHIGIEYNEMVDSLAKDAIHETQILDTPIPKKEIKNTVLDKIREEWDEEWVQHNEARMTKLFYKGQDAHKAKQICKLNRLQMGRMVRILTGHNQLNYYQSKINSTISPLCRLCLYENETFDHFLLFCPVLHHERTNIFLDKDLFTELQEMNWSVTEILDFSYTNPINGMFDPHRIHEVTYNDTDSDSESSLSEVLHDPDDPDEISSEHS